MRQNVNSLRSRGSSRRRRRAGFTLIEVLLVLAILVILAGLSVVAIAQVQGGAYTKAAKSQIAELEQSLEMYRLDVGTYPTRDTGLQALAAPPSDLKNPAKWKGPYVKNGQVPLDPWGNPYQYDLLSGRQYKIWSLGEDQQDNTADDVSNLTDV